MNIAQSAASIFLLYLPAMMANMAPVVATKWELIPWLNKPLDMGYRWKGERLFGSHKTIRGFIIACIVGAITGAVQSLLMHQEFESGLYLGGLIGFGAITGDVVKSFFKRRLHVASGARWIVFDQIDFVIGATIVLMIFQKISFASAMVAIICIGLLSYMVSAIAFALHIKKNL